MSDEEVIAQAVDESIFRIYAHVIVAILLIVFNVIMILEMLYRGDYLISVLIGIVIVIAIFAMVKGIRRAQRYEQALLKKSRDFA